MTCKWFFRNESTENFCEVLAFRVKSNWNPPKGHPAEEIFLSKLETKFFSVLPGTPLDYNLSKGEWLATRGLAEDPNIIIKPADKGSCAVVWDRKDYIAEAFRQLKDNETKLAQNSLHHMRVYIWTTLRISFSKRNIFSLGFSSGTLIIFFSFGQPVKKNLMIF